MYTAETMQTLIGLEGIRNKLAMYAGSKTNAAILHVIKEILGNSIDEFLAGFGHKIEIDLNTVSNTIGIRDYARSIPLEAVDKAVTVQHTSAKFNNSSDSAYHSSLGTNGVGLKITAATGTVTVSSVRDGKKYTNTYTYNTIGTPTLVSTSEKNGLNVIWTPDEGIVTDNIIHAEKLRDLITILSYVTPNLEYVLTIDGKKEIIKSKGIVQFLEDNTEKEHRISPIMYASKKTKELSFELALVWTNNQTIERTYVNLSNTSDGGTHLTAFKTTLTREINKVIDGLSLSGDEARKGLCFILSIETASEVLFSSQEKTKLVMPEINATLSAMLREELQLILISQKDFFEKISLAIEKERKREFEMVKVRNSLAETKAKVSKGTGKMARALNSKGLEMFITEGDSASGGLKSFRNKATQAIMPLRGKPLNVKKTELSKVLLNAEIQELIIAFGNYENFSLEKCPYEKIIMMTDADSDGSHIRILLFGFIYTFYPQLVEAGRIYAIRTPLYSIKVGTKTTYIYSELEMEAMRPKLPKTAVIARFKGLGEIENDVLGDMAFSKDRRLVQYTMADGKATLELMDKVLGADGEARREIVKTSEFD